MEERLTMVAADVQTVANGNPTENTIVTNEAITEPINAWGPLHHENLVVEKFKKPSKPIARSGAGNSGRKSRINNKTNSFQVLEECDVEEVNTVNAQVKDGAQFGLTTFHVGESSAGWDKVWKKKKRQRKDNSPRIIQENRGLGIVIKEASNRKENTLHKPLDTEERGKNIVNDNNTILSLRNGVESMQASKLQMPILNHVGKPTTNTPPLANPKPPDPVQLVHGVAREDVDNIVCSSMEDMEEVVEETPEMLQG